jgi:uncharacterized repeat protein (TIGR01451 family)
LLYVAADDAGLRVVDVEDPANPVEIGYRYLPGSAAAVTTAGGYIYVADDGGTISVLRPSLFPAAPTLTLLNVQGASTYSMTWTTAPTSTYILERSTQPSFFDATVLYSGTQTVYTETEQLAGTWYYRVRAINDYGASPWSNAAPAPVNHWPALDISADQPVSLEAEESVTHTYTLTNTSNHTDVVALEVSEWGALHVGSPITLARDTSVTVPVQITVPFGTLGDVVQPVVITATSQAVPSVSARATSTVTVIPTLGAILAPDYAFRTTPRSELDFSQVLTNTSNYSISADIDLNADQGWTSLDTPLPVDLTPWATQTLNSHISIPAGVTSGTVEVVTMTVTPWLSTTTWATSHITTLVVVPNLESSYVAADREIALLGETVTFTIQLHNRSITATQVQAFNPVPAYLDQVQPLDDAFYNSTLDQVGWIGALGEDEQVTVGFSAVISTTRPPNNLITNTMVIDDDYNPPLYRSTFVRAGVPDLRPSAITPNAPYVHVGDLVTYTLTLSNANHIPASPYITLTLPVSLPLVSADAFTHTGNQLTWNGTLSGNHEIQLTYVLSVPASLPDALAFDQIALIDDRMGTVYSRTAKIVTVNPQEYKCLGEVCVYGDSVAENNNLWQVTGRVRIGSPSRADVLLADNGYVIVDQNNYTIRGYGELSLLANRLYPVLEGDFTVAPDTGVVAPGMGAVYLFDTLSGFTVPTDTGTLDLTVDVVQGVLSGTAQIESHAADLDIVTNVDFFIDNSGQVDAIVGATTFQVWEQDLTIDGGYLDSYGLVLNPELTLPNGMGTVDIPTFHVYPDGVFAGYVDFAEPVAVDLGGWEIVFNDMIFDSDYGLLFPTSQITLPGGATAQLTDLAVNADGSIAYGNIQGDFAFDVGGFNLTAHHATLSDAGLDVVSATLDFPFALTPESDPLALTFQDLRINSNGSVQGVELATNAFELGAFHSSKFC